MQFSPSSAAFWYPREAPPPPKPVAPDLPPHVQAMFAQADAQRAQAEAMDRQAAAWADMATALREGTTTIAPAARAVAELKGSFDGLCRWLRGKWPWILAAILFAVQQGAPDLYDAARDALSQIGPAS